jgi:tetratricopeptide (TPR) repeat protein
MPPFYFPRNAESDYLESLCETGLVGFLFYGFFLVGALVLGVRQLRKRWNHERYLLVVLFAALLVNGLYDTSLRRLPLGILLWSTAGYLWAEALLPNLAGSPPRGWGPIKAGVLGIHCIIGILFFKILAGDLFFQKSLSPQVGQEPSPQAFLASSIRFCPEHPKALFRLAFSAMQNRKDSLALIVADRVDAIAPDLHPTDYVRAQVHFNQGRLDSALFYVNRQIGSVPRYRDSYELKTRILSKLGRCEEMRHCRDGFTAEISIYKQDLMFFDTVSSVKMRKDYMESVGGFRAFIGGDNLKNAYRRILLADIIEKKRVIARLEEIRAIDCAE